jgi:hypothetical protein
VFLKELLKSEMIVSVTCVYSGEVSFERWRPIRAKHFEICP